MKENQVKLATHQGMEITNILVPIDFSGASIVGLEAAVQFAPAQSKIHLINFLLSSADITPVHPKEAILETNDTLYHATLKKERQEKYDELKKISRAHIPEDLQGHCLVVTDKLEKSLERCAGDLKLNLSVIITGYSASDDILEFFTGNQTQRIIRNSDVPVLVVSNKDDLINIQDMLLVTDLNQSFPEKLFALCERLQELGAALHVGHVVTSSEDNEEDIREQIKKQFSMFTQPIQSIYLQRNKKQYDGIQEMIDRANPDIVFMKTYEKSDFSAFLSGSITEKVIKAERVPVVVEKVPNAKNQ